MAMRWQVFTILGSILLIFGSALIIYAPNIPTFYSGGGTGISVTGKTVGGLAPSYCEIPIVTVPNTIHVHVRSIENVTVEIDAPNGTAVTRWQNGTVNQDYPATECGFWHVNITQPSHYFVYGEVLTTAPLYAHPALMYAAIPISLGSMIFLHSMHKRKHDSYIGSVGFEQNIGGRWVFLTWIPILAIIGNAPALIPSYPWLYAVLIVITVFALFSSFALAYVKVYVSDRGLFLEAPFLNLHKHYDRSQIYGYTITQENRQRLLGLWKIPSLRPKKEDQITITTLNPLPKRIWVTSFATRLDPNKIVFRPKSTQRFTIAAEKLGIRKEEPTAI
jgi:hypothetical protein